MNPYAYENRKGVRPVSWLDFHAICKGLAAAAARFDPQIVLAVARGGLYPGTLIAHILQKELYPVRLTRRVNDTVQHTRPIWLVEPPADSLSGQRVLVVDEICDSGETLRMVKEAAYQRGAAEVRLAVLYSHIRSVDLPDFIGIVTDELIINPWDREIYVDGEFRLHPEYAGALVEQQVEPDESFLSGVQPFRLQKGA